MIKHLPEGLVPFEDCGFARYPYQPLEGEKIRVDCRINQGDGVPSLFLQINDAHEQCVQAVQKEEHYFSFEIGTYGLGTKISYRIETAVEHTRTFQFSIEKQTSLSNVKGILQTKNAIHLLLDEHVTITFSNLNGILTVEAHTRKVTGTPISEAQWVLADDFVLQVQTYGFLWKLKRFSTNLIEVTHYTIRQNALHRISHLSLNGHIQSKHIWGTGERFDAVDQKGRQTNGRVVEKFTQQGDQTYLPIPFFMTENGFGWFRETDIPVQISFSNSFEITQNTFGESLCVDRLFLGSPLTILQQFVFHTGVPVCPPDWTFGVWMSANGWNCDQEVDAQLEALQRYDYPAEVMVLEAWSDEMTFYRWNDNGSWKNPKETVKRIKDSGLHLLLWQIPIIKHEWDGEPSDALKQDIAEAIEKGYCIRNRDGSPYRITENWFHHSLLPDFTNAEAVQWWFDKRKYLLDMGVEGFKTDGGEFLFPNDVIEADGANGLTAHNRFPAQYVGAYHDFMKQNHVQGITFSRADTTGAHTRPLHWGGDQLSEWKEMRAQLTAGLSAGLSGILFWGFDIGGFAGELPSPELYLRATAMGCFSPIMQWHSEPRSGQFYATHEDGFVNDRSPWNLADKWKDDKILSIATAYAKLRKQLRPYLIEEAAYCVQKGRPMMAHLCLDFDGDEIAMACEDQYMLGRNLLVAPILEETKAERSVYLPKGCWKDFFSEQVYKGQQTILVHCTLDQIPVYERMSGF